jgi:hypothetical protein
MLAGNDPQATGRINVHPRRRMSGLRRSLRSGHAHAQQEHIMVRGRGSNGSSCTVPSVMRVVLMPVSESKWTDWTAGSRVSLVGFGLAATFALFALVE